LVGLLQYLGSSSHRIGMRPSSATGCLVETLRACDRVSHVALSDPGVGSGHGEALLGGVDQDHIDSYTGRVTARCCRSGLLKIRLAVGNEKDADPQIATLLGKLPGDVQ